MSTERELQEQERKTLTRLSNVSLKAVPDAALHLKTLQEKLKIQGIIQKILNHRCSSGRILER